MNSIFTMMFGLTTCAALALGCMCEDDPVTSSATTGSGGTGGGGAGGGNGGDGGDGGAGGPGASPVVRAYEAGAEVDADFSCLGERQRPEAGASADVALPVLAFGEFDDDGNPVRVPGATVQIYTGDDTTGGACGSGCTTGTEVDTGIYLVTVPSTGWFSYWVDAGDDFLPTLENHTALAPDPNPNWFNAMRRSLLAGLFALLGAEADPTRALLAGRMLDCQGRPVSGAALRVYDGEALITGAIPVYFTDEGLPSGELGWTTSQARWAVANAPAGGRLRVELWGALAEGAEATLLGCEELEAYADTMSSIGIGPLRSDGPTVCLP